MFKEDEEIKEVKEYVRGKYPEPPEGTVVRLLTNTSMGYKKGQIGRIKNVTHTYLTVIEFDFLPRPGSLWREVRVRPGDYEVVEELKKKKVKVKFGTKKKVKANFGKAK